MENMQLDYFIEIAREMSITKAAEHCHVTQQNLSAYVKKLESNYNIQLLERKPRFKLTPAGEILFASALEIRRIYDDLEQKLSELEKDQKVTVSIGMHTPLTALIGLLPLSEFSAIYPNVSIQIVPGYYSVLKQQLLDHEIDMILHVATVPREAIQVTQDLTYRQVLQDQKCIVMSRSLLEQYFPGQADRIIEKTQEGAGASILEFAKVPAVIHPSRTGMITLIKKYFNEHHKKLNIFTEGATPAIQNTFVLNGLAMALSSVQIARIEFSGHQDILLFPLTDTELKDHIIELVYRTEQIHSDAENYLLNWITETFPNIL